MNSLVEIVVFVRGWAILSANFRGRGCGSSATNDSWRQKTRVSGLSRGVVIVILRLAVLILYRRVSDKQTHTDRHTTTANTRAGKNGFHTCLQYSSSGLTRDLYNAIIVWESYIGFCLLHLQLLNADD